MVRTHTRALVSGRHTHARMLRAVLVVWVLAARGCHAAANSSTASLKQTPPKLTAEPAGRQPAPVAALVQAARRGSSDLLDSLRRQLMRDNYDYQNTNTDDERHQERQKITSKNHSYVPRTANKSVSNMHKPIAKQKTAFRHNPVAFPRAPERPNPYDATYSSGTRVALGPSYSPERGDALYPHKRTADEPDSRAGAPVVRAGDASDDATPPPAARHPYEQPSGSVEAQDWRSVQKLTATFGVKPDKGKQRPVQRSEPIDHPIAKKDLLYYMDDVHLRRKNDVSAELAGSYSDAEEPPYGHSHARHHAPSRSRRASAGSDKQPEAPGSPDPDMSVRSSVATPKLSDNVARFAAVTEPQSPADASLVSLTDSSSGEGIAGSGSESGGAARAAGVTVAGANATYKLLRLRARHGARRAGGYARRLLEERGADGVALIRLDDAPFPQFRLPRARRQYMREHRHARPRTS